MNRMTPQELTALKLKFYDALVCDPKLSAIALRVAWLLLSRYLNARSLVAWPSAETLARDLGSSVRTVRRAIEQLTTLRWFEIKRGCGRGHSNVYSANFEMVTDLPPFPAQAARSAETVTQMAVKGDRHGREKVTNLSPESPLRKPIEEPFEPRDARAGGGGDVVARCDRVEPSDFARQGDRGGGNSRAQGRMLLPIQGGGAADGTGVPNRPTKARASTWEKTITNDASQRLCADLVRANPSGRWLAMFSAEQLEAATDAELRKPGAGMAYLRACLANKGVAA